MARLRRSEPDDHAWTEEEIEDLRERLRRSHQLWDERRVMERGSPEPKDDPTDLEVRRLKRREE